MFMKKWPSLLLGTTKFRKIIDKASKDEIYGKILYRKVSVIFQQLNALHIYFHEDLLDDNRQHFGKILLHQRKTNWQS